MINQLNIPPLLADNFVAVKIKKNMYGDNVLCCDDVYRSGDRILLCTKNVNDIEVSNEYLIDEYDYFIWA